MRLVKKSTLLLVFTFSIIVGHSKAQLVANAGPDVFICPGASTTIGGTPTAVGGVLPYTYTWEPSLGLSNIHVANPVASPYSSSITYTVTVIDSVGTKRKNAVNVFLYPLNYVDAGNDINFCAGQQAIIGGATNVTDPNMTYVWTPSLGLSDTTVANPLATPTQTTVYKLEATYNGCPTKTDFVTVNVISYPTISAGNDTTIYEGATIVLNGSGAYNYDWNPKETLVNYYSPRPDAQPGITTVYYIGGTDALRLCPSFDTVVVHVIPNSQIIIYNTFTPNGDGVNDAWIIANILKHPNNVVKVYNRYGKLVFQTEGYANDWFGKSLGENLPAGTYFYTIDLGDDTGVYHGTVTLIR